MNAPAGPSARIFSVDPESHRLRLDRFLRGHLAGESRSAIRDLIHNGHVRVNGRPVSTAEFFVKAGDQIAVGGNAPPALAIEPSELRIIHEDADLLVIDKPAGLATLAATPEASSVLQFAQRHVQARDPHSYVGLVHRLDRGTSGVLVLVKRPRLHAYFDTLFKRHAIEKVYIAAVHGRVSRVQGRIVLPLSREPGGTSRRIEPGGDEARLAVTDYRVVERYQAATLLDARPRTGRMHQIRAHLAAAGHFVLGDRVYGRPTEPPPPRLCLHARAIGFPHPRSGRWRWIEAPAPEDLTTFLARLRNQP